MQLLDLFGPVRSELNEVEKEIARLVASPVQMVARVASHTLNAGGKRFRPMLTMLSAKAVGEINHRVITLAGLIELAHTVALIHDDVIDKAETRRGHRVANAIWGNEATVLVGDYLIAQIILVLSQTEFIRFQALVAGAAQRMCAGQLLEIERRRDLNGSESDYRELIKYKTGELISAACQVGAMAANASDAVARAFADYGMNIGLAFQIIDDLLDITSNGNKLGKPVGNDLKEGKVTLPYIRTLAVATAADHRCLAEILSDPEVDEDGIKKAMRIVKSYDGIEYSRHVAGRYAEAAKRALESTPSSRAKSALMRVPGYVVRREK